jgi:hypothetical protein
VAPEKAAFISSTVSSPSSINAAASFCNTWATALMPASRAAVAGLISDEIRLAPPITAIAWKPKTQRILSSVFAASCRFIVFLFLPVIVGYAYEVGDDRSY